MEYYQNIISQKSFSVLQNLRRQYSFILIGGWAVFLFTHTLKSKDIDLIIDYDELEKIRGGFNLFKNERLKKYEIIVDEIDIDIYLPFYSDLGLPIEEIKKGTRSIEGFLIPRPEILLILKQKAYFDRRGSAKAEKDKIDIFALIKNIDLGWGFYKKILKKYESEHYLEELKVLFQETDQIPELQLNRFQFSKLKKEILPRLA